MVVPHRESGATVPARFVPVERLVQASEDVPAWDVSRWAAEQRDLDD